MDADGLHADQAPQPRHLRAVEHGRGQGLVVVDDRADAFFVQKFVDLPHGVEEAGDGAAGIAAQEVYAALDLQGALEQQLIAREDFAAVFSQESGIHVQNVTTSKPARLVNSPLSGQSKAAAQRVNYSAHSARSKSISQLVNQSISRRSCSSKDATTAQKGPA